MQALSRLVSTSDGQHTEEFVTDDDLDTPLRALGRAIDHCPDAVFIDLEGEPLTFRTADEQSTRLALALQERGVRSGEVVVTLLGTSHHVFIIWFALAKLRAIWAPINLAYRHDFLRHQIDDTAARLVICDADYLDRIEEIAAGLPHLERVICRDHAKVPRCGNLPVERLEDVHPHGSVFHRSDPEPGEVGLILYTSGTTGPSKGCMLSHNYLCHVGRQQISVVPHGPGDRAWTCLPLFHLAAMVATMAALISMKGIAFARRFSVTSFWQDIERSGATSATLMATIFPLVAHAPDTEASRRCYGKLKMTTGVPVTPDIRRIWHERFGVGLLNSYSYGQTEGNRLAIFPMGDPLPPEGSVGRVADEFEVRVVDELDRPVPDGQIGEIVCRPRKPHVMFEGYWRRPDATLAAWRNLWMHTGDLGRMQGPYLFFCDRKKDYLRNKGENISSFEVEQIFSRHPDLAELALHSAASGPGEHGLKLTAVRRPDTHLTELALYQWSAGVLPQFAVPRFIEFIDALPRNPAGKVLKFALRDAGVTPQTWDAQRSAPHESSRKSKVS